MQTALDHELLARYARENCDAAFAELVRRHLDLVWGVAFRVTADSELARDVAQTVFTDLARKARFFPKAATVPGWLYRAALMAARNAARANARRLRREREAMENQSDLSNNRAAENVEQLLPILDHGLQTLPQKDRDAVVLRFFARKSLRELGDTFGITEDAAQKRVTRALERLKSYFERHGHAVPVGTVLATLTTAAATAAPVGISGAILGASCAAASATGWAGSLTAFLANTGEQIVLMKTKIAIATLATAVVSTPLLMQHKTLAGLDLHHDAALAAARDLDSLRLENDRLAAQRQLAAEWTSHQRAYAELESLRAESARLRELAAAHPELQQRLAQARKNHDTAKATSTLAVETVQAEELRVRTVEAMKHLGLAARIYATDNADHFPKTFDDMKKEIGAVERPPNQGEKLRGDLPLDRFEFVQHDREIFGREPELILFREKEPRRLPNGKWTRSYTRADGSVLNPEMATPDFTQWEKPFIARNPASNSEQASR